MSVEPTTIDLRADLHGHVTDFACDQDRGYFREHPEAISYRRLAVDHELCVPGLPCILTSPDSVMWITVTQIAPGVRMRAFGSPPQLASRPRALE